MIIFQKPDKTRLGELIAEVYLLAHGVHVASDAKHTGNDLIGIVGKQFRAIQVWTSPTGSIRMPAENVNYHVLAVVHLPHENGNPSPSKARVYLFSATDVPTLKGNVKNYPANEISDNRVKKLWVPFNDTVQSIN